MNIILALIAAFILMFIIMYRPYIGLIVLMICEYSRLNTIIPEFGTIRFTGLIAGMTVVGFLKELLIDKKIKLPSYPQNKALIIFFFVMGINVVFAYIKTYAFTTFMSMARVVALYFMIICLLDCKKKFQIFFIIFLLINGFLSILGLYNFFILDEYIDNLSIGGFVSDGNDFATVINAAIPFVFFLYQAEKHTKYKIFYASLTILFVVAVICSFSRGGWVSLMGVSFSLILFSSKKIKTILLIFAAFLVIMFTIPQEFRNEFNTISPETETAIMRLQLWKAGFKMFLDHPVIGVGMSNFASVYGRFYMPENPYAYRWSTVHSIYVQLIAEMGLLGVVSFVFIIYYLIKDNLTMQKELKATGFNNSFHYAVSQGLIVGLLGYLIGGAFLSILYYPVLYILAALTVALRNTVEKEIINNQ